MAIKILTAPTSEPVTLDEAKIHCRVDITADDDYLTSLIIGSRRWCEGFVNRKFITQTWNLFLDGWPGGSVLELPLSLSPLVSVSSITYYDPDDTPLVYDAANYVVDTYQEPGRIILKIGSTWPSSELRVVNGVDVQLIVGFGDETEIPQEYKQAMLLLIGHLYENREQTISGTIIAEVPMGIQSLLWLDRNYPL